MGVTVGGRPLADSIPIVQAHECRNCGAPAGMAKAGACYYCGARILPDLGPWLDLVKCAGASVSRFCADPSSTVEIDVMRDLAAEAKTIGAHIRADMAPGKPVFG